MSHIECVFLVGMPRSGTTFLSGTLARHSEIMCGPETQFFNKFKKKKRLMARMDPFWPYLAGRWISEISLSGQKVISLYGTNHDRVFHFLKKRKRTEASLFLSVVEAFLDGFSGRYVLEKTPNHVLHIPEIKSAFPKAKFIRIVRDPRASSLSMCKLPWASQDPVENSKLIADWYAQSKPFFTEDSGQLTVRYEDWIANFDGVLEGILRFLELPMEPGLLEDGGASSSVVTPGEPWKNQVLGGLDASLVSYWQDALNEQQKFKISNHCRDFIEDFGYNMSGSEVLAAVSDR